MPAESDQRLAVERALMDRARANATRQVEKPPRPVLQHAIALVLALVVVGLVLVGFDKFLTSMQKFMDLEVVEPPPAATEPMPAYVVPAAPPATAAAGSGGEIAATGDGPGPAVQE